MEIGLGIHGEKGLKRVKLLKVDELVSELMEKLAKIVAKDSEVVLAINNLGSTTDLEMSIIARAALKNADARQIRVKRVVTGKIMTSLEMHGFSLTLLDLSGLPGDFIIKCLEEPVPLLSWEITEPNTELTVALKHELKPASESKLTTAKLTPKAAALVKLLEKMFISLKAKEGYYNSLDAEVGDGDLGMGVAKSAELALKALPRLPWDGNLPECFTELGEIMAQGFGGTTGPLYAFFLVKGSQKLAKQLDENGVEQWFNAFKEGFNAIKEVGKAELGDRTMLDAMGPAVSAFEHAISQGNKDTSFLAKLVTEAAAKGAENASQMKAKRGRSTYLQGKEVGKKDPGCELVKDWIELVSETIQGNV